MKNLEKTKRIREQVDGSGSVHYEEKSASKKRKASDTDDLDPFEKLEAENFEIIPEYDGFPSIREKKKHRSEETTLEKILEKGDNAIVKKMSQSILETKPLSADHFNVDAPPAKHQKTPFSVKISNDKLSKNGKEPLHDQQQQQQNVPPKQEEEEEQQQKLKNLFESLQKRLAAADGKKDPKKDAQLADPSSSTDTDRDRVASSSVQRKDTSLQYEQEQQIDEVDENYDDNNDEEDDEVVHTNTEEEDERLKLLYSDIINGPEGEAFREAFRKIEAQSSNNEPLDDVQQDRANLLKLPSSVQSMMQDRAGLRFAYVPPENLASVYKHLGTQTSDRSDCFACKRSLGMSQVAPKSAIELMKNYWDKYRHHTEPEVLAINMAELFEQRLRRRLNDDRLASLRFKGYSMEESTPYLIKPWSAKSIFDHYYIHSMEAGNFISNSLWELGQLRRTIYSSGIMRVDLMNDKPRPMIDPHGLSMFMQVLKMTMSVYRTNVTKMIHADMKTTNANPTGQSFAFDHLFDDDRGIGNLSSHL